MDIFLSPIVFPIAIVAFILLMLLIIFVTKYQTAKPDEALIISGSYLGNKNVHADESNNKIKIVRGGGAFVLPVFQRSNRISLLSSKLDVSTPEVYTEQGVPVMCDGTSIIKIGSSVEEIATAAEQFLGKTREELENEAREVLEGHLRSILGSMTVEEIYQNRDKFSQSVQEVASVDLAKMGLIIVSFTIKEVRDKNGYLDSLGKPRIAQVKRDAEIAEAEALKETRIKKAQSEQESQTAESKRMTEIAEALKEKELKLALYKKEQDIAKADADQAYHLQSAIMKQKVREQEIEVEVVERQKQIVLEEKEILRRERQFDSEIKKKADADRYALEQEALAKKASALATTEAEQFRTESLAKAEADKIRLIGLAEAETTLAKGTAEAETKEKIAEAFKKYDEAAILSMIVEIMPQLVKEAAAPLGNIDKISVVDTGSGKGGGANRVTNYATNLLSTTQETLKETLGLDVKSLIENFAGSNTSEPPQE
ncbi:MULTISPECIES: flotillin family protein [Enterococcus]|uniref:Flotillin family protein n=1 Tax=Enterococcus casseliflavus TaxID=37734 RepID=A0ABD6YZW1_ENTCA|nr:flotillin family protein [Enterococcus casseliflavus]EOH78295.1 flotillin [Enterococcus casseliflavus ATCC 49996]EOU08762.1 flotillin [Enterococcus casseliflavus ATCC 49996]MBE9879024.1 flotillin family protein [Enterococcus casseliflavus]MCD5160183.1 flotillin family protein [Enterococcus casseliflavus]MDT2960220.1 flotillin family protein [Enterococcus casseliflavus]